MMAVISMRIEISVHMIFAELKHGEISLNLPNHRQQLVTGGLMDSARIFWLPDSPDKPPAGKHISTQTLYDHHVILCRLQMQSTAHEPHSGNTRRQSQIQVIRGGNPKFR